MTCLLIVALVYVPFVLQVLFGDADKFFWEGDEDK